MTTMDTIPRVRTTTPTNASVSRACRVRGTIRPGRAPRRRRSPRPCPRTLSADEIDGSASVTGMTAGRSALGERVADSPDGKDEGRRRGVVLDLLAQMAHVDVDGLLVLVERLVVAEKLERSEERRVGKECRSRRSAYHEI